MSATNPTPNELRMIARNMLTENETHRAEVLDAAADELERNREVLKDYVKMPARIAALEAQNKKLVEALQAIVTTTSVRIDDPRITHFDNARALLSEVTQ